MAVNTKKAPRRTPAFHSLDDISKDMDHLEAAHRAGTLRHTGNWSAGQVFQHCSFFMKFAIDGFPPMHPPAVLKWMVRTFFKKKAVRGKPPPAGIKLPPDVSFLLPDPDITFDEGLTALREQLARVAAGARFTQPSPLFGDLTHEQWIQLQCGHCALHFGFLHPE